MKLLATAIRLISRSRDSRPGGAPLAPGLRTSVTMLDSAISNLARALVGDDRPEAEVTSEDSLGGSDGVLLYDLADFAAGALGVSWSMSNPVSCVVWPPRVFLFLFFVGVSVAEAPSERLLLSLVDIMPSLEVSFRWSDAGGERGWSRSSLRFLEAEGGGGDVGVDVGEGMGDTCWIQAMMAS